MATDAPEHDRLVARLLGAIERAAEQTPSSDHHPDEETLALFALGELSGTERAELVRHLSECAACRQTAGSLMSWPEITQSVSSGHEKPRAVWGVTRSLAWVGLAAAASLLVAVGFLVRVSDRGVIGVATTEGEAYGRAVRLNEQGRFDEARTVVADAARRGIESDRLRSIDAQAVRRLPGTIALAYAGRLTDFGFEIGGATARSAAAGPSSGRAQEALGVLARSSLDDDAITLNRGHAFLSLQRPREALTEFQRVAQRSPGSALARLGEGLAFFALADYPHAEDAFRASLRLDPEQKAARINLAMTLAEEGKIDDALASWEEVLERSHGLTDEDRRAIEQEVDVLRAARKNSPPPASGTPSKEPR